MNAYQKRSVADLREQHATRHRFKWYQAYLCAGQPASWVQELASYVRRNQLTETVSEVLIEKGARGQFYSFVGFETEYEGQLGSAEELVTNCPLLNNCVGIVNRSEFESMASKGVSLSTLGQTIDYRKLHWELLDDPFAMEALPDPLPMEAANKLLWYLSSLGSGTWAVFQRACRALGLTADGAASRMARSLRLLGHLELSDDGTRWSITPANTISAALPGGQNFTFRVGARLPSAEGRSTGQANGPDRLSLEPDDYVSRHAALELTKALPSAFNLIPHLTAYGPPANPRNRYGRYSTVGIHAVSNPDRPGLYEISEPDDRKLNLLLTNEGRWVGGDWYSLRFLAMLQDGLLVPARYSRATWELALMPDQRPPAIFERALVLASGLLPTWRNDWLIYRNIPPEMAAELCEKMHTPLELTES